MIATGVTTSSASFYVIGGTLRRDAPSYVAREADERLYSSLTRGEFCYVLTARQMGKSSLMVRTAGRLREDQAAVAVLDLTALGQNLTLEQWYTGLLNRVGEQLGIEDELETEWLKNQSLGPLQRWMDALRSVLLERCQGNVVIFIDEIDAVRSLSFTTDEFFAGIRELYNRRAQDPELGRLTFCLLGVATPSDLIRDTRTTPFNIGRRIELTDFNEREAAPLTIGLEGKNQASTQLLRRVLYWTGGHPYLTQRFCRAVAEDPGAHSPSEIDRLCSELFLSPRAREHDDNLLFVRERMLRSEADTPSLLTLYDKVRNGEKVRDDETNPLVAILRLAGITRPEKGFLKIRNRIYEHVFDRDWVISNMPGAELRRQQVAYKRGIKVAALAAVPVFAIGTYLYLTQYRRNVTPPQVFRAPVPPPFWASFDASSSANLATGRLLIITGAPDVTIFVDDQEYGRTAREGVLRVDRIQPGTYQVRAEKPGFQPVSISVHVTDQTQTAVTVKLQAQSKVLALGSVLIQGAPSGAEVSLDGRAEGVTSDAGSFVLAADPGEHTIRVIKDGFLPGEWKHTFVAGEKFPQSAQLNPDVEAQRWKAVERGNDLASAQAYLRDYPSGRFSDAARELEWNALKDRNDSGTILALDDFVKQCREGAVCDKARARLEALTAEDLEWISARGSRKVDDLQRYLARHPQGGHVREAQDEIAQLKDEGQIRDTIQQFELAYNRRDMDQIIALWPSLPTAAQQRTRDLFKTAQSAKIVFTIGDPKFATAVSATVTCRRSRDLAGGGLAQDSVQFNLRKQNDRWIIESGPR